MGFIWIYLGTLCWAIDTLIRYPLLNSMSVFQIVMFEHLILVGVFGAISIIKKVSLRFLLSKKYLGPLLFIGCVGSAISTIAFTEAFRLVNPTVVILLQKLQPFVVAIFSSIILNEKISRNFYLPLATAVLGGVLISFPDITNIFSKISFNQGSNILVGYFLCAVSIFGWGLSSVFGKKLQNSSITNDQLLFGRFFWGLIASLILLLNIEGIPNFESVNFDLIPKLLLMVMLSGAFGMWFYYKGLKGLSAHQAAIGEIFFPLNAMIINWMFLNQSLQLIQILGATLLIFSAILIKLKTS